MRQTVSEMGKSVRTPNAPQAKKLLGLEALTALAAHAGTVPSKSSFDIVLLA
jgi:hypothetical protein